MFARAKLPRGSLSEKARGESERERERERERESDVARRPRRRAKNAFTTTTYYAGGPECRVGGSNPPLEDRIIVACPPGDVTQHLRIIIVFLTDPMPAPMPREGCLECEWRSK